MAENEDGQERTEEASAKKLADAKKKGQVARSKELTTMMVTVGGAAMLVFTGGELALALKELLASSLSSDFLLIESESQIVSALYKTLVTGLLTIWPILAIALLAVMVSSTILGGWTFSLSVKPERMDPIKGVGKIFSLRSLGELAKAIMKMIFIGAAAVLLLSGMADDILALGLQAPKQAIVNSASLLVWFFFVVSLPLVAIAAIDVPWQLWNFNKELKMTRQEVRDEHKESDGRPEVKAKLREMQQAAANNRMMEKVPTADVIITNPTHFAVALKYDEARMTAPMLLAKGADNTAGKIRELATEHDIPIVESPRLARAVFASTDLDSEIPGGLYLAVAQILTYVYQLRSWETMGGDYPEAPQPDIADEYLGNLL
ncbi:Flagellar biosynthetic protein FlhB [Zhongshania aliphaticivorans]|uniref:Flagellar biosynthetic protein FlhB n=1 Tax=Zhongshania aliphaticivorans TaxID=1470434 RepID=A0A5S9NJ92_9GAMM|nr:flagellar biosynthesis protein FlhB [Zhongshania aliphaticivorans]CAA0090668.1 Flagellar biosynthetic protein FlhB [Zhongshania aliphaticivorans]CAA0098164.1 Flagellar biosynthetic protein FlhB [Zhongshania aliphaticivorans]